MSFPNRATETAPLPKTSSGFTRFGLGLRGRFKLPTPVDAGKSMLRAATLRYQDSRLVRSQMRAVLARWGIRGETIRGTKREEGR